MYFLRYVRHLLYKGFWYSMVATGLFFGYATYKGWGITWELARQFNFWLFVLSALAGIWVGFAQMSQDETVYSDQGVIGRNLVGKGLWDDDTQPHRQTSEPLLPFGWRLAIMSLTGLGISLLIWLGEALL